MIIKQVVEILSVDSHATARYRVDAPSGKTEYFDSMRDALLVARCIPGSNAYLELTLAMDLKE